MFQFKMYNLKKLDAILEFFMDDGIHPSELAYKLWSEKLASTAIEMMQLKW